MELHSPNMHNNHRRTTGLRRACAPHQAQAKRKLQVLSFRGPPRTTDTIKLYPSPLGLAFRAVPSRGIKKYCHRFVVLERDDPADRTPECSFFFPIAREKTKLFYIDR